MHWVPLFDRARPALLLAVLLVSGAVMAQDLPSRPGPVVQKDAAISPALLRAEQLAADPASSLADLQGELRRRGLRLDDDRLLHVNIIGPEGADAVPVALVTAAGGRDDISWQNRRDAWVPVDRLSELAGTLPPGYFLRRIEAPWPAEVIGEGPQVIASDDYRDQGADGTGRTIAIIDGGFDGLTEAWNNGDIPSPYHWMNYTPDPLESVTVHGTGCVEAAFDHCPGATFRLYMTDSSTDLPYIVDDCVANGVNVISMSLAYTTGGWHDNSGMVGVSLTTAAQAGIIPVVSAGNYARCHYQGGFNAGDDDWHDFGPGDETINIVIADGAEVSFGLQWNPTGGTYDYELYLFDAAMNEIDSSTNPDNYYEKITWTNNTGVDQLVHLAVERYSGGNTEFEIFTHYGTWQEHIVSFSSTAPPTNVTHPSVIAVGAVEWSDFEVGNGAFDIITSYSGRGPSNDGMMLPDICGPTNCTGFTYPAGMGGTSNSAPNVAGAVTAFWSADTQLFADAVRWLVYEQAIQWRDWGDTGMDLTYGMGGMILYPYAPRTLWVARDYNNTANLRAFPLYTVQAAHDLAETGARLLVFRGGDFPGPHYLNKELTVQTLVLPAVLGQ